MKYKLALVFVSLLSAKCATANTSNTNQQFQNYSVTPTAQIAESGLPNAPVPFRWNYAEVETLDSTQDAFSNAKPTDSTLVIDNYNELETYKVRLRVFMSTLILLPEGDEILSYKVGDQSVFKAHQNGTRVLAVQPEVAGADASLHIEGVSGNFYTFYLRSDNEKSKFVPHLKVLIHDRALEEQLKKDSQLDNESSTDFVNPSLESDLPLSPAIDTEQLDVTPVKKESDGFDFLEEVSLRPEEFNFNYKIEGSSDKWWSFTSPSDELRPTFVFDDGVFTYFQFGVENKTENLKNLPTVFRVADKSDVITRTTAFGSTIRVEGVNNKWTLRLGNKFLCISRIIPLQKRPTNLALEL